MDMDQFESMLKDIDDMIGDLSSLRTEETVTNGYDTHSDSTASKETSPLPKQPTFELETSDHHDDVSFDLEFNPMAVSEEEEPSFTPVARQQVTSTVIFDDTHNVSAQNDDIDLDSILNDLMAFDPGKAVAEAHMKQQPPITTQSKVVPPVQNGAPPQQTPPVMQTSTSTSTQPPKEQVEETEPSSFTEGEQKVLLTRKLSTYNSLNVTPPDASKAENKTVLIKNTTTISSASDLITDADIQHRLGEFSQKLQSDPSLSHEERELKLKEEKMRIALEKMKLASKKKVIVKVFTEDGASKAVVVDEDMTSAMVCHLLAMKNHADESPQWEMIERIGDLGLERVLEDHENVVDIHTSWPRDNKNVFIFKKNTAKYGLMENPLKFFPRHLGTESKNVTKEKQAERAKKILVSEYFSSSGRVPEIDGVLYMKDGYRKPWKKFYFMLRASGLYQSTKGKSTAPKHLVKFVTFHDHDLYLGINFKKVLHSPSQYCFCLKPTKGPLNPATAKDVKVFCAETAQSLTTWMAGIRMAKYGVHLHNNYKKAFSTSTEGTSTEDRKMLRKESATTSVGQPLCSTLQHCSPSTHSPRSHSPVQPQFALWGEPTVESCSPSHLTPHPPPSPRSPRGHSRSPTPVPLSQFRRESQSSCSHLSLKSPISLCASVPNTPVTQMWSWSRSPSPMRSGSSVQDPVVSDSQQMRKAELPVLPKPAVVINWVDSPVFEGWQSPKTRTTHSPLPERGSNEILPTTEGDFTSIPSTKQPTSSSPSLKNIHPSTPQSPCPQATPIQTSHTQHEELAAEFPCPLSPCQQQMTASHVCPPSPVWLPTLQMSSHPTHQLPIENVPPPLPARHMDAVSNTGRDSPPEPAYISSVDVCIQETSPSRQPSSTSPKSVSPSELEKAHVLVCPDGPHTTAFSAQQQNCSTQPHQPLSVVDVPLVSADHTQVTGRPWFHGRITRDEAQMRIRSFGQRNGVYLVRESTTIDGCFVITMFAYGTFRNFPIRKEYVHNGLEKFFIDDGPQFPSLDMLISYYTFNADGMPCNLAQCAPNQF
jgi:hypothetical protein